MSLFGIPKPVTVSVDVPLRRSDVYEFLAVMANHEPFTDHMLTDWRYEGPPSGVGSKARVTTKVGAITDQAEIEVVEVKEDRRIRERNVSAKGKRVAFGTYELTDLPGERTCIAFTFALEQAPAAERALGPLVRATIRRGNQKAMHRLAQQLTAT